MRGYVNNDWFKDVLFSEYPKFLEELSKCSYMLIDDISVKGTQAYPLCYVSISVEVFDVETFRKLKIKYPRLYQKFMDYPDEKPYEIPYDSQKYEVYKLKGEYI